MEAAQRTALKEMDLLSICVFAGTMLIDWSHQNVNALYIVENKPVSVDCQAIY